MDRFRLPTPPITILHVGSMDFGTDEQPGGVGHDMTFCDPSLRWGRLLTFCRRPGGRSFAAPEDSSAARPSALGGFD